MHNPPFLTTFIVQGGFCILLGLAFWVFGSSVNAISALLGGGIIFVANAWHLWRMLRLQLGGDSSEFLGRYYRAEINKLCVVAMLVAIILHQSVWYVDVKVLFISFLITTLMITVTNAIFLMRWMNCGLSD